LVAGQFNDGCAAAQGNHARPVRREGLAKCIVPYCLD
jgi:hypothetical protein